MRNFKKFLTLVLAVMMVVSTFAFNTSAATDFTDVAADNAYLAKSVSLLNYMGIAKGTSDTTFGTDELVTRQQFALFIYRLMKGGKDAPSTGSNTTKFTDLEDATYFYAISWANSQNIVNGKSDVSFDPKGSITLQEAYTMVVRALGYETTETLPYPYGYIEVAEKEEVALDEGLDSNIDYTDALTRGDMAIVLYNAFFAETGVAETKTREKEVGKGTANSTWVLETYEDYPTLCEKVFDVEEVQYQAVATPNYAMSGEEVTDDLGYDAIMFQLTDDKVNDDTNAPSLTYIKAEDIGIDAKDLDNYFLADFTMYVKLDSDDDIDSVLFADSNMVKKTVSDFKFATVTTNKTDSYYTDTDAKLLSGKVTTGTEELYFYNAPYSYMKPTYATGSTDEVKYMSRNENDVQAISFEVPDVDDGYFYATIDAVEGVDAAAYDSTGFYADNAAALATAFSQAYYGGLYEADIYDVDGDGVYEYINYKPYTFFQIDTDDDYTFADDGVEDSDAVVPVVYTNEAYVSGEKFADEDYVIGYINQDTNEIKVAAIVKPATTTVKSMKASTGTITFKDGTTAVVDQAWKYVTNYAPAETAYDVKDSAHKDAFTEEYTDFAALLQASILDDEDIDFYVYDGVVLYQEGADSANLKFTNNLLIPVDIDDKAPTSSFDTKTGDKNWYIYAWVDGTDKYVPVETDDVYPKVIESGEVTDSYLGKLCTYSVGSDGLYTITALGYKENKDGDYEGMVKDETEFKDGKGLDSDTDESVQFYAEGSSVAFTKIAGTRFKVEGLDTNATFGYVVLKSFTKIVVKNYNTANDEYEFLEYDATSFDGDATLENVSLVVSNDVDSTSRENLVVLYGEATDFELSSNTTNTSAYRIISTSTPGVDDNGYYRNYYEIFNPFTGKKETEVAGNYTASSSSSLSSHGFIDTGYVVKLKDNKVDDKSMDTLGQINPASDEGLVWVTEFNTSDKILEVVPVKGAGVDGWESAEDYVYNESDVNIDGEAFIEKDGKLLYQVDNGTVVTMIKHTDKNTNVTKWGSMSLLDATALASTANTYKCYNDKIADSKGAYKTYYAKYIKAYMTFTKSTDVNDLPTVDYIVIVVNGSEPESYLKK